jgi:hypothetical protein
MSETIVRSSTEPIKQFSGAQDDDRFSERLTPEESAYYQEEIYKIQRYIEWEEAQQHEEQYKLERYLEWEQACRDAEARVRQRYAENPGHKLVVQPWEVSQLSDEARQKIKTAHQYQEFVKQGRPFSSAAHHLVTSHEIATYYDDTKCELLGDSDHLGWFREINPNHNTSGFDVQFDYNVGKLNAVDESGEHLIHIRETEDPAAQSLQQKLFIVSINLITQQRQRLYADTMTTSKLNDSGFEMITHYSSYPFSVHNGLADIDADDPYARIFRREVEAHSQSQTAQLKESTLGFTAFKPEGHTAFNRLRPVRRLDDERQLLGQLAIAAGYHLNERGVIVGRRTQSQVA